MPQSLHTLLVPSTTGGPPRQLPVITVTGAKPGPRVAITANVHGDEVTGVGVVHALPKWLDGKLQKGTVLLYPTLNPVGLASMTRTIPPDGRDLNRLFPGDAKGTPTDRHARIVWDDLVRNRPDVLIDLHADSPLAIPYAIVDRAVHLRQKAREKLEKKAFELATSSGMTVLWEYQDTQYAHFDLDRSLTGAVMNHLRIPTMTLEVGPRLHLAPKAVADTTRAVCSVLSHLGMIEAEGTRHESRIEGGPWRRTSGPRASNAGFLVPQVTAGSSIKRGQVIAEIRSLTGNALEQLRCREDGILIAFPERAWVSPGTAVGTLGILEG
jgi:predicted deacylase